MGGSDGVPVSIEGRVLRLSNLDKPLYPGGFSKREVIDYYVAVAPALLARLRGRPATLRRYPDGATSPGFFEKHAARHAPDWVRTAPIPTRSGTADYVFIDGLPSLVWAANLAALELHVPQWTLTDAGTRIPDQLVFDLDPGAPAGIAECCAVAELVEAELAGDGLRAWPKTSGSKGVQLYVPATVESERDASRYAKALAERLAAAHPEQVVATMTRAARPGKVLIDWSQNNPAKTTIAAYSLRAREQPTVSTPLSWDEVAGRGELSFGPAQVRERLESGGDLLDGMSERPRLPVAG